MVAEREGDTKLWGAVRLSAGGAGIRGALGVTRPGALREWRRRRRRGGGEDGLRPPEGPGTFWKAARGAGAAPASRHSPPGALGSSSAQGPEGQAGSWCRAQARQKLLSMCVNALRAGSLQPSPPLTHRRNTCEIGHFPLRKVEVKFFPPVVRWC